MRAFAFPVKFGLNTINKLKKKKKKKKKKKIRGNKINISNPPTTNVNSCNVGIVLLNEDLLMYEILSRLPIKSLVRFRCVCKRWKLIMRKDNHFNNLQLTRSKSPNPTLFIIPHDGSPYIRPWRIFDRDRILDDRIDGTLFMTADLVEGGGRGKSLHTIIGDAYNHNIDRITNIVNGLICFIDTSTNQAVQIYNISTRERSPWIKFNNLSTEEEKIWEIWSGSHFQFGFDPATNQHKLVCVRPYSTQDRRLSVFEVLALEVGDNNNKLTEWRTVDDVPPYIHDICSPSVYVNGSIYWSTYPLTLGSKSWYNSPRPIFMVAFDVGSEKFRTISIPDFILDQRRDHPKYASSFAFKYAGDAKLELLQIDTRVALQIKINFYVIKLWILDDESKKNITTTSRQNWTEVTIDLPFLWFGRTFVYLHSIRDQIIITTNLIDIDEDYETRKKYFSFYTYDWKKNILGEFDISGIPSRMCSISLLTTFNASLFPVPNLSDIAHPLLNLKKTRLQQSQN